LASAVPHLVADALVWAGDWMPESCRPDLFIPDFLRMCWTLELEPELGKAETGVCVYGRGECGSVPAKRQAGNVTRPEGRLSVRPEVKHGKIRRASGREEVNTAAVLHICWHSMWVALPSTAFSGELLLFTQI